MTAITIEDLSKEELDKLLESIYLPSNADSKRQRHLQERWLLMREDYDDIGKVWIARHYQNEELAMEICKHALPLYNALKRGADRLAVAYKRKPRREIKKAGKAINRKWTDLLRRLMFDLHMQQANRYAVAMNTVVIIPKASVDEYGDPMIDFQTVTGAIANVRQRDGASVMSAPGVMAYRIANKEHYATLGPNDPYAVVLDSQWYTVMSSQRKPLYAIQHGLGVFPGVVIRNTLPPHDDWWDPWPNKGVVRTVEIVHRIIAELNLTRRSHRGKQVVATVNEEDEGDRMIESQSLGDPDRTWVVRGQGTKLETLDLVAKVQDFRDHVVMFQDEALEQMTGAIARMVDPDPQNPVLGEAAAQMHNALDQHRQSQVDFLMPSDVELQWKVALLAKASGHHLAVDPQLVKEQASIEYAAIPFVQGPLERLQYHVEATRFGASDQVEYVREQTGETREEAKARLLAMAKDRAELHELLAVHNMPADPRNEQASQEIDPSAAGERPEAATGRAGGRARGNRTRM